VRVISDNGNILGGSTPSVTGTKNNIAPAAYNLTGASGTAVIGVVAVDNGGTANGGVDTSTERTFTITVVGPNTPPVATWSANCTNTASGSPATATVTQASGGNPTTLTIAPISGGSNRRLTCTIANVTPGNEPQQSLSIPIGGVTVSRTGSDITLDSPEDTITLDSSSAAGNRTLIFNSLISRTATGTENFSIVVRDSGDTANGGQNQTTLQLRVVKN
jgi:hypothetical protein